MYDASSLIHTIRGADGQAAGPKYGSCGARARPRYGRTTRRAHVLRPLEGVIIWGPRTPICTRIVDQEGQNGLQRVKGAM